MSLFDRIKNSIAADLHEVLDEKEKKNPIALLNQYLRQCEVEVEKVRKLLERQHVLKEEFNRELTNAQKMAEKRKSQAEVALKAGESQLHEFAYQEQLQYEERATRLNTSLTQAVQHLLELEKKYEEMKHKLKDMQLKRMELMGRENMVRAEHRMNQVIDSSSTYTDKASSSFSDLENYLERLEEKVTSDYYRNTIDARIAQLEKDMKKEETHSN
ncbi:PspA/IM30 family protein [Bacillus salitolerans]|uniref:PspA/IM30 family protein n=1 Tax=Bacillus salitolerans TaxID=1437434 RepID=A0ABW4LXR7_9BACI